ncbi:MAG: peroxide stress protein YaaA [Pseudomonadaceae bacterium]|nr:peroxide stress protein YaaA [Pseudomonadaceae bacterium]
MLAVISPAKSLDFTTAVPAAIRRKASQPRLLDDSHELVDVLRAYTPARLKKLMRISDALAFENAERWQTYSTPFTTDNAKPALQAFTGDVYIGIEANTLSARDLNWAQNHLRILSGLYGLLRPLDLIQAYRLEMGTALKNPRGKDLYQFWGDRITATVNEDLSDNKSKVLVNLASNEYFNAINPAAVEARIVTPVFKDLSRGQYRVLSFFAKRARGAMVRHLIDSRASTVKAIKSFNSLGYRFSEEASEGDRIVFLRDEPA